MARLGILDRFRKTQPPKAAQGRSGRAHAEGYLELEELNIELQGQAGLRIFDEMYRTDPDVRRSLAMVCNPIIAGLWTVEPFGGDDADEQAVQQARAVEWALFEFLRPNLTAHLAESLPLFTRSGFAPFELVWGATEYEGEQMLLPRRLDTRLPRTVWRWVQDELGELKEIEQFVPGWTADSSHPSGKLTIPARDLVYYRVGAEGDNWEGVSLLRPAYKPWYLKDKIERLDAIAQEREATGIPVVYPPANASDEQLDAVEEAMAALKAGEEAYVVMPGPHAQDLKDDPHMGWRLDVLGLSGGSGGGGTRDAQPSLSYHSDKIAAAVVAEFMRLGQAGEGARATADVQQDPFYAGVEALSAIVEDQWNEQVIPRIIALNFAAAEGAPKLSMDKADSTALTELQTFVSGLVGSNALTADDPLEDWLRERADLPPVDPAERERRKKLREQREQAEADGMLKANEEAPSRPGEKGEERVVEREDPDPEDGRRKVKSRTKETVTRFSREDSELREWERTVSLDEIEEAIFGARDRLAGSAGAELRAVAAEIARAVAAGEQAEPDTEGLQSALADELTSLYALGRQTVADELARQGAAEAPAGFARDRDRESLTTRARVATHGIVARILQAVFRRHLAGHDDLPVVAEAEAGAAMKAEALVHAAPALNLGRSDEADERSDEIRGSRYTSILDPNRCERCAGADDDVLRPLADPVRLARKPPNPDCEGGDRCRCLEAFELRREAPPSG